MIAPSEIKEGIIMPRPLLPRPRVSWGGKTLATLTFSDKYCLARPEVFLEVQGGRGDASLSLSLNAVRDTR